jgi:glycerol-3-phosphate dehydrogenase
MLLKPLQKFSHEERAQAFSSFEKTTFDLCIIGGGITGAGAARDAASRGLKVCLIEQNDFASGTSSRSTKLIHGGIRYLENLEFGLVFEALNERHILFEIAPHLVHPLSFVLPVYEDGRVGMFKMGLGMWLYDALALMHAPKIHERLSVESTSARIPSLKTNGLLGSYSYSDAYMDDDRLVIETLRSAARFGATAANYVKAGTGRLDEKGRLQELEITDTLNGKKSKIKAKHFISTVGPWTDQFAETLFKWKKLLRPSKGIHFTLKRERLPIKEAIVMATGKDNRIVFAIPRHEMVILGTTDTDYPGNPADVHSERADVDYLLSVVQQYLPKAGITEKDIVASYSGIRPLVNDGSATESKTSREHVILHTPHNITFVAGGKYTTYRRMARDIIEKVLAEEFSLEDRITFARNQTRDPLNPLVTVEKLSESIAQSKNWAPEFNLKKEETYLLAERYGFEAYEILKNGRSQNLSGAWEMEAAFAIQNTMCLHLRDFMLRRTPLFLARTDHGFPLVDAIAQVFAKEFNWSDSRIKDEKNLYNEHLTFEMGWRHST